MQDFLQRFGRVVMGVLCGFDRVLFRGTLRNLAFSDGLMLYLSVNKILFKDAGAHFKEVSEKVKADIVAFAENRGLAVRYLPSARDNKEQLAREIAQERGVEAGLICVLSIVEPCETALIRRDREARRQYIRYGPGKCLHYYFYYMHPELGLMHARLQTWFPFTMHVCINGREWLARTLDRKGIGYRKSENCFLALENIKRTQQLADEQLSTDWPGLLSGIAQEVNPLYPKVFGKFETEYYWSAQQTEWASDVMFKTPELLAETYPRLIRHAIHTFKSPDVLRFLGQRVTLEGKVHGHLRGEVMSSLKERPEGVRIKHYAGANSVKLYDKQGSVLRAETTINNPRAFKVYRPKEGGRKDQLAWRRLRQGVADLHRRAEVSQACNERYLSALAKIEDDRSLEETLEAVCQPVRWEGRRHRGLNPFGADAELLSAIGRGEHNLNGFRNRDVQAQLYKHPANDKEEARRRSGQITRKLRLLRAHGLIRKVPKSQRYELSDKGRTLVVALGAAKQASTKKLLAQAA